MRLSIPLYIIPFVIIYRNGLLLVGEPQAILISILLTLGVTVAFVHGITGVSFFTRLGWKRRFILLLLSILLIVPNWRASSVGLFLFALAFVFDLWWARREKKQYLL